MSIKLTGTGRTDVGVTRDHNEDNFLVVNREELFMVADGVGGRAAGEVASKMAVEVIYKHVESSHQNNSEPFIGQPDPSVSEETNRLGSAIRLANSIIHESSKSKPSLSGMGSTIVGIIRTGKSFGIAHVGDSRAYLIRDGMITQVTDDHSLVNEQIRQGLLTEEEARTSKVKNVITRALGALPDVEVDMSELPIEDGDKMLLCSDGLCNMVTDEAILDIVEELDDNDAACRKLIDMANANGGKDNISVVIVEAHKTGFFGFLKKLF